MATKLRPLCHFVAALLLSAFGLNWPWEMVQMPAYAEMAGRPWMETVSLCTAATLGDAAITLGIYGISVLLTGCLRWGLEKRWNVYAAAALLGGACAVGIEWRALAFGRWSYTERMPVVPGFGVGLWPLLQLTLLVPAALWIAAWWARLFSAIDGGTMKDTATPREVLDRHLDLSRSHSEEDFLECYREDSFLIMPGGVRRGLEEIRACYRQLNQELPNARYTYEAVIVEQDVGFLEWSAESDTHTVSDGADSYVIQDGYIRAQTIHYTLVPKTED